MVGERQSENGAESGLDLRTLLQGKWEPLKGISKKRLLEEVELWRVVISYLPENVKYYLAHIGSTVRLMARNYHGFYGDLLQPYFELQELEVGIWEKVYDNNAGVYFWERKVVRLPMGSIMHLEFIAERYEEVKEDEEALREIEFEEVAPLVG